MMMQASRARLFKEYKEVQREKTADPDIQLVCDDSNIFKWTALIKVISAIICSIKHTHLPSKKKDKKNLWLMI